MYLLKLDLSLCVRKPTIWVPTRFNTNRPVQSQMRTRSFKKKRDSTTCNCVAKTKTLISCAFTAQLICAFVIAYANCCFSYAVAPLCVFYT